MEVITGVENSDGTTPIPAIRVKCGLLPEGILKEGVPFLANVVVTSERTLHGTGRRMVQVIYISPLNGLPNSTENSMMNSGASPTSHPLVTDEALATAKKNAKKRSR
jgi:hypothetical protein